MSDAGAVPTSRRRRLPDAHSLRTPVTFLVSDLCESFRDNRYFK
jgi:hypothetical protein